MTRTTMVISLFVCALAFPAAAQDTFVHEGLRSSCEWMYDTRCAWRPVRRKPRVHEHVRTRTVYVPYRVKDRGEIELLRRGDGRYGYRSEVYIPRGLKAQDDIVDCNTHVFTAQSDPKLYRDAKAEAMRRWQGLVAAKCGEIWLDWRRARKVGDGITCWRASTGERSSDGKEGNHQRCEARGIARRGDKPGDADKLEDSVEEERDDREPVYLPPPPPRR